jgi:phosphoglycolate phosphatase-like HAD superfamily hydrolase
MEVLGLDLEGPIVKLDEYHELAFAEVVRRYGWADGFDFVSLTRLSGIATVVGGGDRVVAEAILKVLKQRGIQLTVTAEEIVRQKATIFEGMLNVLDSRMKQHVVLGLLDTIGRLQKRGVVVGICSLTPDDWAETMLAFSGVGDLIPRKLWVTLESVGSDPLTGHRRLKSDYWKEFRRRSARVCGCRIRDLYLYVAGDSPTDVLAWKECGIPTDRMIGLPQNFQVSDLLVQAGLPSDQIFTDWHAVSASAQFRHMFS